LTAILNNEGFLNIGGQPRADFFKSLHEVEGRHGTTFQMQICRPDNVAIEILVRGLTATGMPAAAAAVAAAAAAVTPLPLHGCSVQYCFSGLSGCGRPPPRRRRGKAVNGFFLHWCAFRSLRFGGFHASAAQQGVNQVNRGCTLMYQDELDMKHSHTGINQSITHLYVSYWYIPVCTMLY
jgi:hypothetical protein